MKTGDLLVFNVHVQYSGMHFSFYKKHTDSVSRTMLESNTTMVVIGSPKLDSENILMLPVFANGMFGWVISGSTKKA